MPHSNSLQVFLKMIRRNDFVVLDTETTDLNSEVCQIAVIDCTGAVLIDTLVKPSTPIHPGATAVHGIRDEDVAGAPTWSEVSRVLVPTLTRRDVVVYNAQFDRKMLANSTRHAGLTTNWYSIGEWWCVMEAFAEVYGDWNSYHHSYRWQKLETAARYYRIQVNGQAHSALTDCQTTLAVVKAMAVLQ